MRKIFESLVACFTLFPLVMGMGGARAAEPVDFLDRLAEWTAREELPKAYECGNEKRFNTYSYFEIKKLERDRKSFWLKANSCSIEETGTPLGDIDLVLTFGENDILFKKEIYIDDEHAESVLKLLHQKYGKPDYSDYRFETFFENHQRMFAKDSGFGPQIFHAGDMQIALHRDSSMFRKGKIELEFNSFEALNKLFQLTGISEARETARSYCLDQIENLPYAKLTKPAKELEWYDAFFSPIEANIHFVGKNIVELIQEGPVVLQYSHIVCSYNVIKKNAEITFHSW